MTNPQADGAGMGGGVTGAGEPGGVPAVADQGGGGPAAGGAGGGGPAAGGAGGGGFGTFVETSEPTTASPWVLPRYAAIVVAIVALCLLGIVAITILNLDSGGGDTPTADPNASTIAAVASAAIAALTSLTAAYFGIKVASEQSAQAAASAATAVKYLGNSRPNFGDSTANGNPAETDF